MKNKLSAELITYVEDKNNNKLFSFFIHDYKSSTDLEGNIIFIDGGVDNTRSNVQVKVGHILTLIKDIREQFTWIRTLDENGNNLDKAEVCILKEINSNHILAIINYLNDKMKRLLERFPDFTEKGMTNYNRTINIFNAELQYRKYIKNESI